VAHFLHSFSPSCILPQPGHHELPLRASFVAIKKTLRSIFRIVLSALVSAPHLRVWIHTDAQNLFLARLVLLAALPAFLLVSSVDLFRANDLRPRLFNLFHYLEFPISKSLIFPPVLPSSGTTDPGICFRQLYTYTRLHQFISPINATASTTRATVNQVPPDAL
jgi:hypothetical protein